MMVTNNEARKLQRQHYSELSAGSGALSWCVARWVCVLCLTLVGSYFQSPEVDANQAVAATAPVTPDTRVTPVTPVTQVTQVNTPVKK